MAFRTRKLERIFLLTLELAMQESKLRVEGVLSSDCKWHQRSLYKCVAAEQGILAALMVGGIQELPSSGPCLEVLNIEDTEMRHGRCYGIPPDDTSCGRIHAAHD
jgi:hypothetical protein